MELDHGFILPTYMGDQNIWPSVSEFPPDLLHVLRYANANGQEWLILEDELDPDPNLPWYELEMTNSKTGEVVDEKCHKPLQGPPMETMFSDLISCHAIDPTSVSPDQLMMKTDRILTLNEETVISEGDGVWISVAGISLLIENTDNTLSIAGFTKDHEQEDPIFEQKYDVPELLSAETENVSEVPGP